MPTNLSLREIFGWLATVIAIWVLASIPGFWLHSAFHRARIALQEALAWLTAYVRDRRQRLFEDANLRRRELLAAMRFTSIDDSALTAWNQLTEDTLQRVADSDMVVETARKTAARSVEMIERAYRKIGSPVSDVSSTAIAVPADQWASRTKAHRVALLNAIVSLSLLTAIVLANAQLTGLVLRDLLPAVQPIFGVPIPYVIALVIVLAEAGFGLIHSNESHQQTGSERKLTGAWLLWTAAAAGVVILEAWLYSLIRPSSALVASISSGGFSFVGGLLGLSVFGLGRLAHSSVVRMLEQQTAGKVARQIGRLNSSLQTLGRVVDDTRGKRDDAETGIRQLLTLTRELSGLKVEATREFTVKIEAARTVTPSWVQPVERPLTLAELTEKESRAYFWTVLTVFALGLLIGGGTLVATRVTPMLGGIVGLSLGLLAVGVGVAMEQVRPRSPWMRYSFYVFLYAAIGAAVMYSGRILQGILTTRAFLMVPPAYLCLTGGFQMGGSLAILALALWRLYRELLIAAVLPVVVALWLVLALTRVLEFVFGVVAWPMILVVEWYAARSKSAPNAA